VMFPNRDIQVCVEAVKRNNFDKERAIDWILNNPDFLPTHIAPPINKPQPQPQPEIPKKDSYLVEIEQVIAILPHVSEEEIRPYIEKYKGDTFRVIEVLMEKYPLPEDDCESTPPITEVISEKNPTDLDEEIEGSQSDTDEPANYDIPTEEEFFADWFVHPLLDVEDKQKDDQEKPPDLITKLYQE